VSGEHDLRKGEDWLPPNQHEINEILRWSIDHPGIVKDIPELEKKDLRLKVDGLVEKPVELTWKAFMELPQSESISDFHCVESWSVHNQKWEGSLFSDLMELVKPLEEAKYVWFECKDGYTTSLPIHELKRDDVILAHHLNDEELAHSLGGPVRLVVPHKYAYKSPMWLTHIEFLEEDRLGYWEKGIYSNTADVWANDRYKSR